MSNLGRVIPAQIKETQRAPDALDKKRNAPCHILAKNTKNTEQRKGMETWKRKDASHI